ncbi:snapalysin family zinc-dependent metalloprotease [Nonomuraea sp. C10]|uniref:snapalysin family zinc-dependent metalloprotease n=1 Tax=Nonomuraea sp. C10 TaxID=2600577 RepID=UPI0011CE2F55|nr:snapalysin family zinc-dependent metalloprotease [Nonomuraea sp. C10]TXK40707.1 snapalysin family zinc-dependent metalloprotease [Nonomuraea sp. C10]
MPRPLRLALSLILTLAFLLATTPAQATALVRVLRYDASRAAEFRGAVDQAAQIWNASVVNVRLVAGTPADFVVVADDGWPRAQPTSLGRGRIWMGRQATDQGYHPVRIAAHEIGHILGLPDRRTGRCTDLMSGSSAPVSCTNANPSAAERAEVDRNFAGSTPQAEFGRLYVDR